MHRIKSTILALRISSHHSLSSVFTLALALALACQATQQHDNIARSTPTLTHNNNNDDDEQTTQRCNAALLPRCHALAASSGGARVRTPLARPTLARLRCCHAADVSALSHCTHEYTSSHTASARSSRSSTIRTAAGWSTHSLALDRQYVRVRISALKRECSIQTLLKAIDPAESDSQSAVYVITKVE